MEMRGYATVALKPVEINSLLLSSSERKRQKDRGRTVSVAFLRLASD